jgi:NADH-quinone oxidoreductase subunit M
MGGIRLQDSRFASMFLIIMLASIALPGTFNFISEFTILYSLFSVNIWLGVLAGTTVIFGAVYMLKMFQDVMLGDTNTSNFKKITFSEGIVFIILIVLLLFFGLYPKPILDLVSPPLIDIVRRISIY